ncbi:MAG: hypothetical protein QME40_08085, partial [bacterium]|nr:hypothetical protein [bacterium]
MRSLGLIRLKAYGLCFASFILLATLGYAGHVGTTGCQFLKLSTSARAIGMGEAFCGVCDD